MVLISVKRRVKKKNSKILEISWLKNETETNLNKNK